MLKVFVVGNQSIMSKSYLRDLIADQSGYDADHPDAEIIMDANESPFDLPEEIKEESFDRLRNTGYNRYPDALSSRLRELYSDYVGIPAEQIVAGNGSDELITYLISAVIGPGDKVLVPSPTFSMYNILAEYMHAEIKEVPLTDRWDLSDDFINQSRQARLTFISYPNNPTGNCFDRGRIKRVLEQTNGIVVIDEAYFEFANRSFVNLLSDYPNLVVLRTLSKGFGLAGIRTGFLLGPEGIVNGVNTVRLPYNLNKLSVITAEVALEQREKLLQRNRELLDQRDRVFEFLQENNFRPEPTDSNFILFQPDQPEALYSYLLEQGIRVRVFSESRLQSYLRLSVGTPSENDQLIEVLRSGA
mgnify:CR=1 FL=1